MGGCSILIVDDDPFQLEVMAAALSFLEECRIQTAEGGAAALRQLEQDAPDLDLVICDLQMPEVDGIEVLRGLREHGFRGQVILTSGEEQRILDTATRLGREYGLSIQPPLEKPIDGGELRARVLAARQALEQQSPAARASGEAVSIEVRQLAEAIEQGSLSLHFQPKVGLDGMGMSDVEALVRWTQADGQVVSPEEFIPLAEQNGLMDGLTERVIALALDQQRAWADQGLELAVSINLSMSDLRYLDFPERLSDAVKRRGLEPRNLVLEITESQLAQHMAPLLDVLTRLRLRGFPLSIDDFGTGYSSLEQLREAPFTELKIDRGFVHQAYADSKRRAILEASISLAHKLGMNAVAEGAEDEQDWDLLVRLGCDQVQGYYISRPLPAEAIPAWMEEFSASHG